jgi:hypothetical protein
MDASFWFLFSFPAEEIMQPKSLVIHHTTHTRPSVIINIIIVVVVVQQRCKQEKEIMER